MKCTLACGFIKGACSDESWNEFKSACMFSGVHVCWSEHSDSSFVYGFISLDYGLGTMTTTASNITCVRGLVTYKAIRQSSQTYRNYSILSETV